MPLTPYQKAIEDLANSMGLRGAQQSQVYSTPQYQDLVTKMFGDIPLPAGINPSAITSRTAGMLEYSDPQGYIHQLIRELSGVSPRVGEVREGSTNRPAVLPQSQGEQGAVQNLLPQLVKLFNTPTALSSIDPATLQLLATMKQAEDQALNQQFQQAQGTTVAQLTGQGIGASSIAGQIMAQLLQGQGLVKSQAQGQQAQRQLGVQQFLTQNQQTQNQDMQSFVLNLLNQALNRDVSGAQIGEQKESRLQQGDQFIRSLQENIRQFDEQLRMQQRQNMWNNIFKGAAVAAAPFTGGLSSLFAGGASAPTAPTYFPSSQFPISTPPTFPSNLGFRGFNPPS